MGKDPPAFDILAWNADSTRLPAAMHSQYLRACYLENRLVRPNALELDGTPVDLARVETPLYVLSAENDHIAPWRDRSGADRRVRRLDRRHAVDPYRPGARCTWPVRWDGRARVSHALLAPRALVRAGRQRRGFRGHPQRRRPRPLPRSRAW